MGERHLAPVLPVVLEGQHVRLEPLTLAHTGGLLEAGRHDQVWTYLTTDPPRTLDEARAWIDSALQKQAGGSELPFAILDPSGAFAGSTRYLDVRPKDAALEIGATFLVPEHWRTAVNTECKLLLLGHAFETLGAQRVCLKTDGRNVRSQEAIARLGAVREGTLRRHLRTRGGFLRDTVYYSILSQEWPDVRDSLRARLDRGS
jgi:RimJ/RimL family protein N-acetyltransferase